jgi:hypothetical protein
MNDSQRTLSKNHLYHYTSQKGLLGILQTNKLWMTNILYLNDSSEFTQPMNFLETERINNFLMSRGMTVSPYNSNEQSKKNIYLKGKSIFVVSFSGKGDDLSQWRGYCSNSGGFCIEFDKEKLFDIVKKKERFEIGECLYMTHEKMREELNNSSKNSSDQIIEKYLLMDPNHIDVGDIFGEKKRLLSNIDYTSKADNILNEMIDKCPFWKDDSFKDEKEYRIIYRYEGKDIKFDEGKSMIIPHIEFSPVDDDTKLPISKIWVGPTPHPELSKLSVESLLKSEKYEGVEVEISTVPYRSW